MQANTQAKLTALIKSVTYKRSDAGSFTDPKGKLVEYITHKFYDENSDTPFSAGQTIRGTTAEAVAATYERNAKYDLVVTSIDPKHKDGLKVYIVSATKVA